MPVLISVAAILLLVAGLCFGFHLDKKEWNGGVCRQCGQPWRHFDNDSQGGRGYTDSNDHTVWISYPVDRK